MDLLHLAMYFDYFGLVLKETMEILTVLGLFFAFMFFLDKRHLKKKVKLLEEANRLFRENSVIQKDVINFKVNESQVNFKIATVSLKALEICIERIKKESDFEGITVWLHDQYWHISWDEKENNIKFDSNPDISKEDMDNFDIFLN